MTVFEANTISDHDKKTSSVGLFLTSRGLERTRNAYDSLKYINLDEKKANLSEYTSILFSDDWINFDDVYVGLYAVNLSAKREVTSHLVHSVGHTMVRAVMNIILDINVPKITKDDIFEDTLLNEFDVFDIIRLRKSVQDLVPYQMALRALAFGCVLMEFSIFGAPNSDGKYHNNKGMIGLNEQIIETSPSWKRIIDRFKVRHIDLQPV